MNQTPTIAFVTGGNRGIGLETARQLAARGITVVIGARDAAKGEAAVRKLKDEGLNVESIPCDVTRPADHASARDFFDRRFGRLDILINNAGVAIENLGPGPAPGAGGNPTTSPEALRATFDANFFAPIALTQTLLPLIRKSAAGRIVNLSSILGSLTLHADPKSPIYNFKALAYDASKSALNAFSIHLAYDLRDTPIKVNSAHPGWVKTEMGGDNAPMELVDGAKTSVQLATLGPDGPTGGFFHMGQALPW